MSGELIKIEHDSNLVQLALKRLSDRAGNLKPAFKAMAKTLALSTERRFDTETGPDGKKWQDVKASTRKRKKNPKILTESTKLRDGMSEEVSADGLLFGSDSPYGAIHQLGGEIKQEGMVLHLKGHGRNTRFSKPGEANRGMKVNRTIKMPARPFLGVSSQDELDLLDDIEQYILG
jgi:phage virion morphogenesis protein